MEKAATSLNLLVFSPFLDLDKRVLPATPWLPNLTPSCNLVYSMNP